MARGLILFELNEVPFRVLDDYVGRAPDSALARLLGRARQYESVAADDPAGIPHGSLSPWITWPTVHRGVPYARHGVTHLGQDLTQADAAFPPVWRILAEHGVRSGVFGSLHTHPLPADVGRYDFFVPDTFAATPETHPESVEPFQAFNLAMARESPRNVSARIAWEPALRLLAAVPHLGLRARTFADVGAQLVGERLRPHTRTRRRTYQAVLGFDVWMRLLRRSRPAFSTFFTNHVASAMHRFWAAAYPDDYRERECTDEWIETYRDEIAFSMRKLDGGLAGLLRFVDAHPEYVLVLASSMGQAATVASVIRTQLYATDVDRLMAALGLAPDQWSRRPAMAPDVSLFVAPEAMSKFREAVATLVVDGKPLRTDEREGGFVSLIFGHSNLDESANPAALGGRPFRLSELGLENVVIDEGAGSTAYHVPEGSFVVYDPARASADAERSPISTAHIAPFVLDTCGVRPPDYMDASGPLFENGSAPQR